MRWFTPVVFALTAGYVAWYNSTHAYDRLIFPFLDRVPGVGPGADELGHASVVLLSTLSLMTGLWTWWQGRRGYEDDESV